MISCERTSGDGRSDSRAAEERARYLDRTTALSRREALALAYSERGFSTHGIAEEIDATAGTVSRYLDRATARFGPAVVLRHAPDAIDPEPVTAEEIVEWSDHYRSWWSDAARDHRDILPSGVRHLL